MDSKWLTTRGNCFIEFQVEDLRRYRIFLKLFDVLKTETQSRSHFEFGMDNGNDLNVVLVPPTLAVESQSNQEYNTVEDWLTVFDPSDLAYLGLPNHEDSPVQLSELNANPSWKTLKAFADIVESFDEITFELEICQLTTTDQARLEFFSSGFPYGGRHVLEQLLTFFGFVHIIISNC